MNEHWTGHAENSEKPHGSRLTWLQINWKQKQRHETFLAGTGLTFADVKQEVKFTAVWSLVSESLCVTGVENKVETRLWEGGRKWEQEGESMINYCHSAACTLPSIGL